ncbi:hypothetical protein TNIN_294771 [Trichonephila inaurata madagascariensis]|uniref:Uncharacterized protein n=1 Tax=Trichonephila inaurata madagascariensis TaxID=2747483 RepID=A0A8X6IF98_9ARAC|nr:hypothetical protein TNIN_294771 [Trichonephila inaurata madagascariensis]
MVEATRQRINDFVINSRFINDGGMGYEATGIKRYRSSSCDGPYLQKLIEGALKEFEVRKEQIIRIVADIASNRVETIQKMNGEIAQINEKIKTALC